MPLTLRTLGTLALEQSGQPITGAGSQRRPLAVLAVLAAAGSKGVARERLETLLWPDSDSERAKAALKQTLYSLRRDAQSADIIVGTSHLQLNPEIITSDLSQFLRAFSDRRFLDAVELYRGPFMDGVEFPRLDELERFVSNERNALAAKYRLAAESLARESTAKGDHSSAVKFWTELAGNDPYSSQIALGYLEALGASGERERAIKHGAVFQRLLQQELGAEVTPEILSLIAQLKKSKGAPPEPPRVSSEPSTGPHTVVRSQRRPKPEGVSDIRIDTKGFDEGRRTPAATLDTVTAGKSRRRNLLYGSLLASLTVAVVGFLEFRSLTDSSRESNSAAESDRVVILPFENRTGDNSLDMLGAMAAEWVTDGLSQSAVIPVTDPGTAAAAAAALRKKNGGQGYSISEIAKITGARNVVSGSYYRRGDSLEFNARVADATNGKVIGAIQPFTVLGVQSNSGISVLRSRLLSLLAQIFDARLAETTTRDAMPPAFESYREFVTGVDLWARETSGMAESDNPLPDPHHSARAHFRRAYTLDTTFVTPLVWVLFTLGGESGETKPLLDSLNLRLERLSPLDRHAVDYFTSNLNSDAAGALRAAEAASDLAPRSEWSWNAGQILFPMNRPRETLKYFSRLDPDAGWMRDGWEYYWYLTAQTLHMLGDLKGTHAWLSRARKKFPENVPIAAAYARSLALTGRPDSVNTIVREILQASVNWKAFYVYSVIEDLRRHGRRREAWSVYRELARWYESRGKDATEPDRRDMSYALFALDLDGPATDHFEKLLLYFPKSTWRTNYTGNLAVLEAKRGDAASANRLIESVPREKEQWPGENSYWRSRVAAQIGRKADAVNLLRRAFAEGYPLISLSHSTWYDFPTLQGYPPFESLVASDR